MIHPQSIEQYLRSTVAGENRAMQVAATWLMLGRYGFFLQPRIGAGRRRSRQNCVRKPVLLLPYDGARQERIWAFIGGCYRPASGNRARLQVHRRHGQLRAHVGSEDARFIPDFHDRQGARHRDGGCASQCERPARPSSPISKRLASPPAPRHRHPSPSSCRHRAPGPRRTS